MANKIPISDAVEVSVSVEQAPQTLGAFKVPLIIDSEYVYGATGRVITIGMADWQSEMTAAGYGSYNRAWAAVRMMALQDAQPSQVKIGQWNDGTETIAAALAAIQAVDADWYLVAMTDRSAADVESLSDTLEADSQRALYIGETGDADVLAATAGNVAEKLLNAGNDKSALVYYPQTVQVSTLTWDAQVTAGTFTATVDGNAISEAFDTNHDTTIGAIATAIQALDTVTSATASDVGAVGFDNTITITSSHALNANLVENIGNLTSGAATWAVTTDADSGLDFALLARMAVTAGRSPTKIAGQVLSGVLPYTTTSAQRTNLLGLNVLYFGQYGSISSVGLGANRGKVASGARYIDQQILIDALTLDVQAAVLALLQGSEVLPYTQEGIEQVGSAVRGVLSEYADRALLAPSGDPDAGLIGTLGYRVTTPAIGDIAAAQKAARNLPDVTFLARGAGALQAVVIAGTITEL